MMTTNELLQPGMYDYGWRQYMPDIGRWNGVDQLAEKYMPVSPYAYVLNNPVSLTDPDGRDVHEGEDGWTFTGSEMMALIGYLENGGSYSDLVSNLENGTLDFGNGPVTIYWGNYNTGQPVIVLNEATIVQKGKNDKSSKKSNTNDNDATNKPKDIIVLLATDGASGLGHEAVIIGNDKDGYVYISKDGRANGDILKGGDSKVTIKVFGTYEEAMDFAKEQYNYDQSLRMFTTRQQDMNAITGAYREAKRDFHILYNNCSYVVAGALTSAGLGSIAGLSIIPNINFYEIVNGFLKK